MKEDDTKEFAAKLGRPDFAKIAEEERRECARKREAKQSEEDTALICKYLADHRKFLCAVERKCKTVSPIFVDLLHSQATNTIDTLDELIMGFDENEREEVRKGFSRTNASWPVSIESKSEAYLTNKVSYIFEELEVGAESILNVETFKDGGGDISKASKIVVRRFIRAIKKCQLRARLDPSKQRSEMECLAISLDELDSLNASHWFAVIVEWVMHYGKWDKDQVTMTAQQIEILGADISVLGDNAEEHGNSEGEIYRCESTVLREVRNNLWRAFLQIIKPSISKELSTRAMKNGKWVSKKPTPPSRVEHRKVIQWLSGGQPIA